MPSFGLSLVVSASDLNTCPFASAVHSLPQSPSASPLRKSFLSSSGYHVAGSDPVVIVSDLLWFRVCRKPERVYSGDKVPK